MTKSPPSPIVLPAIIWISGIIAGKFLHAPPIYFIVATLILIIFSFLKRFRFYFLVLAIFSLGILRISLTTIFPTNHINSIVQSYPQLMQPIKGRITSEVRKVKDSFRFTLEINEISDVKVDGKINFSTRQTGLKYGDVVSMVAFIRKIAKNSNPSSFDYQEYLASKNIFASGYAKTIIKVKDSKKKFLKNTIINIRKFIRGRIENRFGANAGFIKAIVIGDKTELAEWRTTLNKAGLSHLLAVSGLHVGILYLIVFSLLKLFIRNRNIVRVSLIILLIIYGEICSWSPSVSRAVIMLSLYLLAKIIQRKPAPNNILAISLITITFIQPNQLFSVGLQLSFTAVFVLLNIVPRIRFIKIRKDEIEVLSGTKKILNGILIIFVSSGILNIFLAPVIAFNFNQFNMNGIIGNLIGIPLISILLPLSLLIIFLPFGTIFYQNSFRLLMLCFDKWSGFSASLPMFSGFFSINSLQMVLIYLILFSLAFQMKREDIKETKKSKKRYLLFTLLIATFILIFISFGRESNNKLKITFFDCGLGDLFLVETPDNESILIDSGPPDFTYQHLEKSAFPYLKNNGISTLDWVIITHAHNDHYGGLDFVLQELKIKNLVVTDEFQKRKIWKTFEDKIEEEKCEVITISDTTHLPLRTIKCKILHPDNSFYCKNINNMSIVVRMDYFDFSVLFTGDLENAGEKHLLLCYPEFLDCDFLKIGHHGSKTSSSIEFIKAVTPEYGFISTSLKNRFSFPHEVTLDKYDFLGPNLFISGIDGALQIITDGKKAHFKTFLSDKEFVDDTLE